MSQREKAGLSRYAPPLPVAAEDEGGVGPEALTCLQRLAVFWFAPDPWASLACGEIHAWTCMFRSDRQTPIVAPRSMLSRFRRRKLSGVLLAGFAVGVAHPDTIAASAGSAPPVWFGPPFEPSVARGVEHPASR